MEDEQKVVILCPYQALTIINDLSIGVLLEVLKRICLMSSGIFPFKRRENLLIDKVNIHDLITWIIWYALQLKKLAFAEITNVLNQFFGIDWYLGMNSALTGWSGRMCHIYKSFRSSIIFQNGIYQSIGSQSVVNRLRLSNDAQNVVDIAFFRITFSASVKISLIFFPLSS